MLLSVAVGLAGGVLLGTFAFEMLPKALELSSLPVAVAGFILGFGLVYLLDLYTNRWWMAGPEASQRPKVKRMHRRIRPHGSNSTVLAAGTSVEELIEGLMIGIGAAFDPGTAIIVAAAICIDNVSEAMSIGELIQKEESEEGGERSSPNRRIMGWTSLIGASLFVSAAVGWFLLGHLGETVRGFLFALGAGGMFYLTVTDLVPEAESHHFQQSAAAAIGAGFLVIMVLSELM
jgi:zinc transporter, ZIP family